MAPDDEKVLATNRKAYHDYFVEETYEAGIALTGTEIQSARLGRINLRDGFARAENGEVLLYNVHISPYDYGNRFNHDPLRVRKLLLHKSEIRKIAAKTREQGYTLVPLRVYLKQGLAKVELALAKGKRLHDKREAIAERTARREAERALKERNI